MLDLESITLLFDEKLSPLKDDIRELKEDQKQVVELLLAQARQDEKINRINEHLQECKDWRKKTEVEITEKFDILSEKEFNKEVKKEHYLWEIIKILGFILAGGTVGSAISKLVLY